MCQAQGGYVTTLLPCIVCKGIVTDNGHFITDVTIFTTVTTFSTNTNLTTVTTIPTLTTCIVNCELVPLYSWTIS